MQPSVPLNGVEIVPRSSVDDPANAQPDAVDQEVAGSIPADGTISFRGLALGNRVFRHSSNEHVTTAQIQLSRYGLRFIGSCAL